MTDEEKEKLIAFLEENIERELGFYYHHIKEGPRSKVNLHLGSKIAYEYVWTYLSGGECDGDDGLESWQPLALNR